MNPLYEAAHDFFAFAAQRGWRSCLIGGIAAARWGRPRATQDVDVTLQVDFGSEEDYVDQLLSKFAMRRPDAREFALRNRVVLLESSNGVGLDIALGGFPFEEAMIERAQPYEFAPGVVIPVVSASDLIVLKAFANRPLDWKDIEGVMVRERDRLDWPLIERELAARCEMLEDNEPLLKLRSLRTSLK